MNTDLELGGDDDVDLNELLGDFGDGESESGQEAPQANPEAIAAQFLADHPEMLHEAFDGYTQQQAESAAQAEAQAAQEAEWRAAIEDGQNYGDWSAYGKLVAEAQQAQAQQVELERASKGVQMQAMDSVAERLYPNAIGSLTADERGQLARAAHPELSEEDWLAGVMATLADREAELAGGGGGSFDPDLYDADGTLNTENPLLYTPPPSPITALVRADIGESD